MNFALLCKTRRSIRKKTPKWVEQVSPCLRNQGFPNIPTKESRQREQDWFVLGRSQSDCISGPVLKVALGGCPSHHISEGSFQDFTLVDLTA